MPTLDELLHLFFNIILFVFSVPYWSELLRPPGGRGAFTSVAKGVSLSTFAQFVPRVPLDEEGKMSFRKEDFPLFGFLHPTPGRVCFPT